MRAISLIQTFNRGLISPLALARSDYQRTPQSAETQTNFIPRILGSMMLRPGLQYIGGTRSNNKAIHIPFIFSNSDTAIIEFTDVKMRVRLSETVITRPSVSTAVTNGTFDTNLTGWTSADETGATSAWASGGYLSLTGTGYKSAIRKQTLSVAGGDQSVEHALTIVVARGELTLLVGSTDGNDDYITQTVLTKGTHSLSFTPTGNVYIQLQSNTKYATLVDSISIASSGAMEVTAPYGEADLGLIRWDQSADVIYLACDGYKQMKIERRGTRSWSLVDYLPNDGPFRTVNLTTKSISASATSGDVTLTATNGNVFKSTNVGSLFKISSLGQYVTIAANGEGQWTDSVRVTGVGTTRNVSVVITGTWSATVTLQRSLDDGDTWADVTTYTVNTSATYNDALDNQITLYRIGIDTGDYTSGTATLELTFSTGSIDGIVRVVAYNSATSVDAIVLKNLGGTTASAVWAEGLWSDRRGFPTSTMLYEGRLIWAGRDKFNASIVDAYESFDDTEEGDSGPISRSIGSGPVDVITGMLPLNNLVALGEASEYVVKATSLDEPLTPTNFNIKAPTSIGSAAIAGIKVDSRGLFVAKGGAGLYEIVYDIDTDGYISKNLTVLIPEIYESPFNRVAVQRKPDTRVHCIRDDGTVAIMVYDVAEETRAWIEFETDGIVEDAFVMPSTTGEDTIYYCVKRTINGSTVRYLEKWALESECQGGTLNKQADSFILYSGASTTTITGLSHLEGESVVVWGGGADLGSYTVSGGQITGVTTAVTSAVIGLGYTAQYKSTKLFYGGSGGVASLGQIKRVDHVGMILRNTHKNGVTYGSDFSNLDSLPDYEDGAEVATGTVHSTYDEVAVEFNGIYDTDSRVCLQAQAPRPVTVMALVLTLTTNEKV